MSALLRMKSSSFPAHHYIEEPGDGKTIVKQIIDNNVDIIGGSVQPVCTFPKAPRLFSFSKRTAFDY